MTAECTTLETAICPQCGEVLYRDVGVCYGCLYEFDKESAVQNEPIKSGVSAAEQQTDIHATQHLSAAPKKAHVQASSEATMALSAAQRQVAGVVVSTGDAEVWSPVPCEGIVVGRDASCGITLHATTVSRQHVRLVPTKEGMEATDLGATNPAVYRGNSLTQATLIPWGSSLEVCDVILRMEMRT